MNEKKEHLPVYGIGPALCYPMALVSAIGIWRRCIIHRELNLIRHRKEFDEVFN